MKGVGMSSTWRTVQLFISSQAAGVFEVEIDTESKEVRCSCPKWKKTLDCKHVRFVTNRLEENGHYSILIPNEVPEELAFEANVDPKKFREFVLKYAKIEVL